jgi:uncharacterized YigZ family protein
MSGAAKDPDRFGSVEDGPEIELTVQGSRFLGQAFRADDEDQSAARLDGVRRRYHDATHHCWAARLGDPEAVRERWSDDGEPSGTAGVPILGAVRHVRATFVLVVVTRYFGGTKLGTGGLVRAYGEAARQALSAAPARTLWRQRRVAVEFSFELTGAVESVLARHAEGVLDVEREFTPEPRFLLTVKASRAPGMVAELRESTSGRATVSLI